MTPSPESIPEAALEVLLAGLLQARLAQDGDLLAVKDARSGRYVHANDAMTRRFGPAGAGVVGSTDAELFDAPVVTALRAAEQTALGHPRPLVSEHRFEHGGERLEFHVMRLAGAPDANGRRWLCSLWSDQRDARRREGQLQAALAQLEQQQRANEALRRELADQALRDPASGLYTRARFDDQLRRELDLSTREHREFAIVFIEIDPLGEKALALGDAARERVLEAMGRLLRGGTRAMDASCRLDDRRFTVLLSGVGLATAHSRMEGLRRQCATQIVVLDGQELGFTVSMGVASFPHTAQTQDELVEAGRAALAEARRRGGNQVTLAAIRFEAS
ncbi:MAG: diguanylate cyclase [Rubrivivax sp. SCN 70-15]|nr:MAG: diguanylate cyclase [Rubrivivax sp. SCN 70-15]